MDYNDTLTAADIEQAVANARDRQFADWVVVAVGLACERNPDLMRVALGKVFDLTVTEDYCKRITLLAGQARQTVNEHAARARELIDAVNKDVEALEARIDGALHAEEQIQARMRTMKSRMDNAAKVVVAMEQRIKAVSRPETARRGAGGHDDKQEAASGTKSATSGAGPLVQKAGAASALNGTTKTVNPGNGTVLGRTPGAKA